MNVVINGHPCEVHDGATVADAVRLLTTAASGLAVAVNGAVTTRSAWGTTLADGDEIEVLTAVQGG